MFPEGIAATVARPLTLMAKIMGPFVTLLTASTAGVLKLLRIKDQAGGEITQEEVEMVLAEGASAGLIEPEERTMISEVLRLGDRAVRVAMTPRRDLFWISLSDPEAQQRAEIRACPYSRIVVTQGSDVDDPVGVVHKKDLLDALLDQAPLDLTRLMVTPLYIPETTSVLRALELLKGTPLHMALVVDEFGALEGVVTATDLLEMIAGDFPEAHDGHPAANVIRREDGSWLVDGRTDLDELAKALDDHFETNGGFHTAAGLVLHRLGRFPAEAETFRMGDYLVEVLDMDERRIDKLLFRRAPLSDLDG
jgi:putative hemolysin